LNATLVPCFPLKTLHLLVVFEPTIFYYEANAMLLCHAARVIIFLHALAARRSGHRITLKNRRPGFKSRQGVSFLGKHSKAVMKVG
jgi:hypothetical protein